MKKVVFVLGAVILAGCIFFAGCSKTSAGFTIKPGVLMIGMDIGYPPMEYFGSDGETPMGFDVEMGKEIANRLGLKAEFINTDWGGIFAGVDTNRYDAVMSSVTITPERIDAHNFSKPYIANTLAMVLLKDSALTVRSPEELGGFNVTFQADTTADFYMERLRAEKGVNYIRRSYDQVLHCFPELEMGRVDVIVTDFLVAFDYASPDDSPFEIVWLGSDDPEVFGICMRRGNDALSTAIDKVLEEMFEDGTMQKISDDVFGMDLVTEARNQW